MVLALAGDSTITRALAAVLGTGRTYGPSADRCQASSGEAIYGPLGAITGASRASHTSAMPWFWI